MNIQVRYQSKSGNTKFVAEAIAQAAGVSAADVDTPLSGAADLLFLGGAIYAGSINGKLKKFLKSLPDGQKIALFSTASGASGITAKAEKALKGKSAVILSEYHAVSGDIKDNRDSVLAAAAKYAADIMGKAE